MKRFISVISLILTLFLLLAACGTNNGNDVRNGGGGANGSSGGGGDSSASSDQQAVSDLAGDPNDGMSGVISEINGDVYARQADEEGDVVVLGCRQANYPTTLAMPD